MNAYMAQKALVAAGYGPILKKAKTAYGYAATAYANRGAAVAAAKRIQSVYKRYKRIKRSRGRKRMFRPPSYPSGTATSKSTTVKDDNTFTNLNDRTLTSVNLANIGHTTTNNQNGRQRNILNLRGFKLCMEFKSLINEPLYVNIAVIVPRQGVTVATSDFFRANTSNRTQAFSNTILTSLEFHCLPINTDKYAVLMHKRFLLKSSDDFATNGGFKEHAGKNYMNFMRYVKFNRQVRYSDNADVVPEQGAPYLCHWVSKWGDGVSVTQATSYQVREHFVTYFKESR